MGCISWIVHVIIWICINNEQIWLPGNYGSDFEQYLNRLQLDPISLLVNFSHELVQIMTTYDFLWAKQAILSNVWTNFNLTNNDHIWIPKVNFMYLKVAQIITTFEFLRSGEVISWALFEASPTLPTWNGSNFTYYGMTPNFTYLEWLQFYLLWNDPNFTYLEWLNYIYILWCLKLCYLSSNLRESCLIEAWKHIDFSDLFC